MWWVRVSGGSLLYFIWRGLCVSYYNQDRHICTHVRASYFMYVRLHHGVYISCVFVGVERLSFTRAWRVGRLLCGRVVCCLRALFAFLSRRKIYIISDIISDMIS